MKWYVLTDLEGACRVNRWDQTRVNELTPGKLGAMTMLTLEINAAVQGLLDIDPYGQIVVWDGHGNGGIDERLLSDRAWLISRGTGIRAPYGLDSECVGQVVIGQHAMAGTPHATLAHTYSSQTVEYYELNGQRIGELGCRAVMAGAMGVPTIFVSGDDLANAEARALIPGVLTVDTKQSLDTELALHRPPHQVYEEIREQVALAARGAKQAEPVRWPGPYELVARVLPDCSPDGYLRYPGATKLDDRTVRATADDLTALWV
ncbi:MAG: M55 family metallopeptidase [Armatimonadetes bacterium]|nr:M55 family metallopeptidase [Armatimonadota bacterium]